MAWRSLSMVLGAFGASAGEIAGAELLDKRSFCPQIAYGYIDVPRETASKKRRRAWRFALSFVAKHAIALDGMRSFGTAAPRARSKILDSAE